MISSRDFSMVLMMKSRGIEHPNPSEYSESLDSFLSSCSITTLSPSIPLRETVPTKYGEIVRELRKPLRSSSKKSSEKSFKEVSIVSSLKDFDISSLF